MRAFHLTDDEIQLVRGVRDLSHDDLERIEALVRLLAPDSADATTTPILPPLALVS